ncbi:cobalamin-binding protein [Halomonas piscis]|uniref:Cobalamin-binding protein n=1 Tax=Halomonas piscis TaxID=3031727 RepID=A0ABY9YXW2_9GAMM|nr:cobalamin-binding protein [Halomonas piscis]WNK19165.1 cobalamin-binding protein [Halomonas piscis]
MGARLLFVAALTLGVSGLAAAGAAATGAERCAVDDLERRVCLEAPARRLVALSPGATELAFAAGAGERVVAVVAHSDYPARARKLPSVGDYNRIDLEALVGLRPDLVIGWVTGNPEEQLETLESLGTQVFYIEPRTVEGVAGTLKRIGRLAGSEATAEQEAEAFLDGMEKLEARYAERDPVRTFYQVWDAPLMTLNGEHLIGRAIEACGGANVFGDQPRLVPRLDDEAVLEANPEVIITGSDEESMDNDWLGHWRQYPNMAAVAEDNLYTVPADPLVRPTPRFLQGAQSLCERIDQARPGSGAE